MGAERAVRFAVSTNGDQRDQTRLPHKIKGSMQNQGVNVLEITLMTHAESPRPANPAVYG